MRLKLQKLQIRRNEMLGSAGDCFSGWYPRRRVRSINSERSKSYSFITEFSKLLGKIEQGHTILRILNPIYTADKKQGK